MKAFAGVALLLFVIVAGWRIGSSLDSDALGMAIGMFFGILAGVPTALLMLLAGRRKERHEAERSAQYGSTQYGSASGQPPNQAPYAQPPVIIVTGGQQHAGYQNGGYQNGGQPHAPPPARLAQDNLLPERHAPDQGRKFRVVGESEEWLDEW